MMRIAVIGAGKWGSALHLALKENHNCFISSLHQRDLEDFVSIKEALECEYLIFALSSQGMRVWLKENFINKGQKILIASKGIEDQSCQFLDEIFLDFVPKENFCVLSGPSFAAEVMQKLPTALMISGINQELCK
ncbi:glycerol-3-phosphate dehydrogenase, partial [Campylobacter jejuni]|nr:glycerol-3-phosphate dehydrogenase [Campylobacter jejuni]